MKHSEIQGDEVWDICCAQCGHPRNHHFIGSCAEVAKGCQCGICDKFEPRTVHEAWRSGAEKHVEVDVIHNEQQWPSKRLKDGTVVRQFESGTAVPLYEVGTDRHLGYLDYVQDGDGWKERWFTAPANEVSTSDEMTIEDLDIRLSELEEKINRLFSVIYGLAN